MDDIPFFEPGSLLRREDHRLVTGAGRYVADLAPPETVHLAFVRSTEAHARITSIDTDAGALPGVVGVFTAEDLDLVDIPGDSIAVSAPDFPRPHLAREKVRYVGEPVAVVAADSPVIAVDGAEMVWVDYEALPAVTDPRSSLLDDVLIHEAAGTNTVHHSDLQVGEVKDAYDVVAELEVTNQRLAPNPIEPLVILAVPEDDRRLTVYISHQRPHGAQTRLAELLGIDSEMLHVIVPDVGGAFGMKGMTYPEHTVTAALALRLARPVMWAERRREHLSGGTHGRGSVHRVRLMGTREGRIERAEIDILADVGAYPHNGASIPIFSRLVALGLYDITSISLTTTSVVTNAAPTGSYRGAGRPEAAYALERAVDAFARMANLDPVDVRMANFLPKEALPHRTPTGAIYDSGDYAEAMRRAVDLVGLAPLRIEQQTRLAEGRNPIGVGFGAFVERAGGAVDAGEYGRVEVDRAGSMTIRTGSASSGQGHETAWAQVAAAALGIAPTDVVYVAGDTDKVARGTGTFASRSTQIGAAAIWRTAHVVRQKAIDLAAEILEGSPADIVLADGMFSIVGVPGTEMTWSDVAEAAHERGVDLTAEEWFVPGAQTFPYGVHAAVVEVDLETGDVRLERMVAVDDCGNVLNPMIVEGQLHGSLMQGIGQALYEGVQYSEEGQLLTSTFVDYAMPRASDAPPISSERLVHPAPSNPLGAKGTGEAGCIGAPPAIVNAVLDALAPYGVTDLQMPLRPATVWTALERARKRRQ
ncbi:MAG TPA: xanthine dehydrogenase family protein molybdopterin-binding subunit, partial [Acidimicrobiia bacterium]|nr:xanthine dehydrogenase family protein molybdopterin-binding subunit [Acidimicrobiia bacterium]